MGQARARKLARRYSLKHQFIIDYYFLLVQENQRITGLSSLDIQTFENLLRQNLVLEGIDVRQIDPVYIVRDDAMDLFIKTRCSKYQRMVMCRFDDVVSGANPTNDPKLMMHDYLRKRGIHDLPQLD